jgi:Sec-independent protein translocase protein TatA
MAHNIQEIAQTIKDFKERLNDDEKKQEEQGNKSLNMNLNGGNKNNKLIELDLE